MGDEFLHQRDEIDREIHRERMRQEEKWGQQNHDPFKYLAILGEEVGESNKAAIESYNFATGDWSLVDLNHLRTELIQVAAVTKAMIECLDRGTWLSDETKARNA